MVAATQYDDTVAIDLVDKTVLLADSSGPVAGKLKSKLLGLADPPSGFRIMSLSNLRIRIAVCLSLSKNH